MAPAHPHATGVAVYPAVFLSASDFLVPQALANICINGAQRPQLSIDFPY